MNPKLASISINLYALSKMKKNPLDCSDVIVYNELFNFDIKDILFFFILMIYYVKKWWKHK
jgi:hypothetical protein